MTPRSLSKVNSRSMNTSACNVLELEFSEVIASLGKPRDPVAETAESSKAGETGGLENAGKLRLAARPSSVVADPQWSNADRDA